MKHIKIARVVTAVLLLLAVSMAGCASAPGAPSAEPAMSGPDDEYWDREGNDSAASMPADAAIKEESEMEFAQEDIDEGSGESVAVDRLVVRNGSMELVVENVSETSRVVGDVAATFGGHVVSSSVFENNGRTFGSVVIRVDADKFDAALGAIRVLAVEVLRETTSSVDVTEEFVDLSARKNNLVSTEQQLLTLMEQAGTVEELLAVQKEASRVRGEIEQLEGRIRYLQESSAMSLIEVYLNEAVLSVSLTADSRMVDEGEAVSFDSEVSGGFTPYTYYWRFGDGGTSNDVAPSYVYEDEGVYSVELTVTDDRGATANAFRDYYVEVHGVWAPVDVLRDAVSGLGSLGRGLVGLSIWLLVFTPLWLVIGGIVYLIRRRVRKGRA